MHFLDKQKCERLFNYHRFNFISMVKKIFADYSGDDDLPREGYFCRDNVRLFKYPCNNCNVSGRRINEI